MPLFFLYFSHAVIHNNDPTELCDLLAADHLVTVELLGQHSERGLDDATTQTQHQMKSGLCKQFRNHEHNSYSIGVSAGHLTMRSDTAVQQQRRY